MLNPAAFSVLFGALLLPICQTRPQRTKTALPVPVISVGKGSLSGFGIANNIRRFFKDGRQRTEKPETDDDKTLIGDEEFINEVHEAILRNEEVAEGWNKGAVPIFPNYHGNKFYEPDVKSGSNSRSSYRNIMGPVNPVPDAAVPEGMSRPKSPILLPEDPKGRIEHGARNENGTNVNVVASGYSGRKPGHTSKMKKCSKRDGVETCVVESDENNDSTWKVSPGISESIHVMDYGPAPLKTLGHGTIAFPMSQNSLGGIQFHKGGIPDLSIHNEERLKQQRPNLMDMPASPTMGTTTSTTVTTMMTTKTTTTPAPALSKSPSSPSMSPAQMHTLRDAIMDPMMMAVGTMLAMAGAYIAIAIEELNQANAFAFAQLAAAGGR